MKRMNNREKQPTTSGTPSPNPCLRDSILIKAHGGRAHSAASRSERCAMLAPLEPLQVIQRFLKYGSPEGPRPFGGVRGEALRVLSALNFKCLLCFALLLLSLLSPAEAAPATDGRVELRDFRRAYELETQLEGALYRVRLPVFVYSSLTQSQQRDLAVFNADGEIVPFLVQMAPPAYTTTPLQTDLPVPFFKIPETADSSSGSVGPLDVYVKTGTGGQVVEIKSAPGRKEARDRRYLLDMTSVSRAASPPVEAANAVCSLSFFPDEETESASLNAVLSLYESDDLRGWRPLVTGVPMIRLKNRDSRLESGDRLDLPRAPGRYLLLKVEGLDPSAHFGLREILFSSFTQSAVYEDEQAVFEGKVVENGAAVEYDILGAYPVAQVNFVLRSAGLHRVSYSARTDPESPWRRLGNMELFLIRSPSSVQVNEPVAMDTREGRYWRVDFDKPFAGPAPEMRIGWRGYEVCFLAQGNPPYLLALGSGRADLDLQNRSLLRGGRNRDDALEAKIGREAAIPDAAPPVVEEKRESDAEWQRYGLWGLLVLGGLLLSGIAWKLMKDQK